MRVRVTNASEVGRKIKRGGIDLEKEMDRALTDLSRRSVQAFRAFSPKRDQILAKGIRAKRRGQESIDVTLHALDPESGFDYAAISRFGHAATVIYPTASSALQVRFRSGTVLRGAVSGSNPSQDWAEQPFEFMRKWADSEMEEVGRRINYRVFT